MVLFLKKKNKRVENVNSEDKVSHRGHLSFFIMFRLV